VSAYRGRFAPTPSGPLHFGSLVAAVGSYLDARSAGGEWLLRIDDVDTPRVAPGATDAILRCLEACGLEWDGEVAWQSRRGAAYAEAVERLRATGLVYPCDCSRKDVEAAGIPGIEGPVYPGTCRNRTHIDGAHALRVRTDDAPVGFDDFLQGRVSQRLESEVGDFVLRRADGIYGYHLACAVDDAAQGVTHVVRGADLLASTPRQIYLQRLLGLPQPHYLHLPIALDGNGAKLAKQTLAPAVDIRDPAPALAQALAFLGQPVAPDLGKADARALVTWAIGCWQRDRLPRAAAAKAPASM
jgi:glutamyl-Q tRNA(Asp) synthetase